MPSCSTTHLRLFLRGKQIQESRSRQEQGANATIQNKKRRKSSAADESEVEEAKKPQERRRLTPASAAAEGTEAVLDQPDTNTVATTQNKKQHKSSAAAESEVEEAKKPPQKRQKKLASGAAAEETEPVSDQPDTNAVATTQNKKQRKSPAAAESEVEEAKKPPQKRRKKTSSGAAADGTEAKLDQPDANARYSKLCINCHYPCFDCRTPEIDCFSCYGHFAMQDPPTPPTPSRRRLLKSCNLLYLSCMPDKFYPQMYFSIQKRPTKQLVLASSVFLPFADCQMRGRNLQLWRHSEHPSSEKMSNLAGAVHCQSQLRQICVFFCC